MSGKHESLMMDLHSLSNVPGTKRARKRIGRGMSSGTGKTSGRGHKGQMSRKGSSHKPGFEGGQMRLIRRIPKRGFHNPTRTIYSVINVEDLLCFDDGSEVTLSVLKDRGLIKRSAGGVKVLGRGELGKKLTVKVTAFSGSACAKIKAAGGVCEVVRD